jgi:hypothetical protein
MAAVELIKLDANEVAKAGEVLRKLNEGAQEVDLTPCGKVAAALGELRKPEHFRKLDDAQQEQIRKAARVVNHRFGFNDGMLLNFLSEAFGAARRPAEAEAPRRDRIGTFFEAFAAFEA